MLKIFKVASKRSIYEIVQQLIDEGFLKQINKKLSPTKRFFALPLLGNIQAGFPIIAMQSRSYLTLDEYLIDPKTPKPLKLIRLFMIQKM